MNKTFLVEENNVVNDLNYVSTYAKYMVEQHKKGFEVPEHAINAVMVALESIRIAMSEQQKNMMLQLKKEKE